MGDLPLHQVTLGRTSVKSLLETRAFYSHRSSLAVHAKYLLTHSDSAITTGLGRVDDVPPNLKISVSA